MSPGLRSRPSLSGLTLEPAAVRIVQRVAGTTVPAFVERSKLLLLMVPLLTSVAGTTVPAFVERGQRVGRTSALSEVSPGLRSRPSLSVAQALVTTVNLYLGVAGTTVPAFVERSGILPDPTSRLRLCRRDYGPGLR